MTLKPILKSCINHILAPMVILFTSSGRLDWLMGWIIISISGVGMCINAWTVLKHHPDFIAERYSGLEKNPKAWDRVLAPIAGVYGPALTMLVCGLDKRFAWSTPFPLFLQTISLLFIALGYSLVIWAISSNRFFFRNRSHPDGSGAYGHLYGPL